MKFIRNMFKRDTAAAPTGAAPDLAQTAQATDRQATDRQTADRLDSDAATVAKAAAAAAEPAPRARPDAEARPEAEASPRLPSPARSRRTTDVLRQMAQNKGTPTGAGAETRATPAKTAGPAGGIWDLEDDIPSADDLLARSGAAPEAPSVSTPAAASSAAPSSSVSAAVSAAMPAPAPAGGRKRRTKTRLIGFDTSQGDVVDLFQEAPAAPPLAARPRFPVGWILVVEGPGRGECFALSGGMSQIGRGDDQAVQLDFGDAAISRTNHAAIVYDPESRAFLLGHGGKSNIVRLNDTPVISNEPLNDGDRIRLGETTLCLKTMCGPDFDWADTPGGTGDDEESDDVAIA